MRRNWPSPPTSARQDAALASETLALRQREVDREELAQEVLKSADQSSARPDRADQSPGHVHRGGLPGANRRASRRTRNPPPTRSPRTQSELHIADSQLRNAQQQLDAAVGDVRAMLAETVAAHRCSREKLSEEIDSLTQRLQQYAQLRLAWSRRYQIATADRENTDHEVWGQLKTFQKETKAVLEELAQDLRMQIQKMREVRSSISSVAKESRSGRERPAGSGLSNQPAANVARWNAAHLRKESRQHRNEPPRSRKAARRNRRDRRSGHAQSNCAGRVVSGRICLEERALSP